MAACTIQQKRNKTPKYRVTYFEITGLGEPFRYLLSYGNLEFEDRRIRMEDWPAFKASAPLGLLPLLEVDGKVLYQSTAIGKYLGNVVGLAGATLLENWEIDAVADTITELRAKCLSLFFDKAKLDTKALKVTLKNETIPFFLSRLDSWAKQNGGYLAAGKLTWADLLFVATDDFLHEFFSTEKELADALSGYPNLETVKNNVRSLPSIKAWLAKRPASNHKLEI